MPYPLRKRLWQLTFSVHEKPCFIFIFEKDGMK